MKDKSSKINSKSGYVIAVVFPGHVSPFLFGSMSAIYEMFDSKKIGCTLYQLWEKHLQPGGCVRTDKCNIFKLPVLRKSQKK